MAEARRTTVSFLKPTGTPVRKFPLDKRQAKTPLEEVFRQLFRQLSNRPPGNSSLNLPKF